MSSQLDEAGDLVSYGKIVLFGDSITQQAFNPEWRGFASILAERYSRRLDIVNRGFSGYSTDQALAFLPRIFPRRDDDLKLVVVFFGANDASLPEHFQHVPLDRYVANMRALLTAEPLKGKVVCVTPPALDAHAWTEFRSAEHTAEYARACRQVCTELDVPCADVWQAMIDATGWRPASGAASSVLPGSTQRQQDPVLRDLLRDGLHPGPAGYKLIADLLIAVIEAAFPALKPDNVPQPTPLWQHVFVPAHESLSLYSVDTRAWTGAEVAALRGLVPDTSRIDKFVFDKDKRLGLGSELLQRYFCSQVLGVPWRQVELVRDARNRPSCRNRAAIKHDFNVSHHAGLCVLAGLREAGRVGIDITHCTASDRANGAQLLRDFEECFTVAEWSAIDGDADRFYQIWALKEAFLKARGDGITADLRSIEFRDIKWLASTDATVVDAARCYVSVRPADFQMSLTRHADGEDVFYIAVAASKDVTEAAMQTPIVALSASDFVKQARIQDEVD